MVRDSPCGVGPYQVTNNLCRAGIINLNVLLLFMSGLPLWLSEVQNKTHSGMHQKWVKPAGGPCSLAEALNREKLPEANASTQKRSKGGKLPEAEAST